MGNNIWRGLMVAAISLGVSTGYAFAQGHGHGNGGWKGGDHDRGERFRRERHYDRERMRDHREHRAAREEFKEHRHRSRRWAPVRESDHRPPGWDRGKKTGWRDCDVPPGQAKKAGCGGYYTRHRSYWRNRRTSTMRPTLPLPPPPPTVAMGPTLPPPAPPPAPSSILVPANRRAY